MKKIFLYLNLLLVTLLLASCQDFLDVNEDPNNPTEVSPSLVLPVAQGYTAELMQRNGRINSFSNLMMYNWSQSDGFAWYPDEFKYLVTSSFYQGIFNDSYTRCLKQYNILEQLKDEKYTYYVAIGKIMKAYHYQLLVDFYGDVPYSEALQRSKKATPKYDDAKVIYTDLIAQLTAAIDLINTAPTVAVKPTNDDAMFKGDMTNWKRFANTLKLRILVRQSDMAAADRPSDIQAEINIINAEGSGYITDNVGVNPGYLKETDKQNPLWDDFGKDASDKPAWTMNNQATCATDYIITYLQTRNDKRIDYIYEKPTSGHLGVPQGLLDYDTPVKDAFVPENVSNLGPGILKSATMNAIIFTLAESYFNQAEAALKGFITSETPQSLYESGITASFAYLGADGATLYYSQALSNVGWDGSLNKLEAIITQKWIAVNSINAEQSFFDYSRTGYPSGLPKSLLASTPDRPVRLFYPAGEISSNGANVPSQPDAFTGKIFWAQ